MTPFYPLTFVPVLKDYIWGGRTLSTRLGRTLPPDKEIAESWEVAAHANGDVAVAVGPLAGRTLSSLHHEFGLDLIGTRAEWAQKREKFPLLIKLLDAHRRLSVQVHPDDAYAQTHEGNELGKSEMWVVLHADPGAAIILGVKEGTDRQGFREAVEETHLENLLHEIPVQTGDFVCVPAGSLHAILGGLLIAEIQQNSDTTYRVYDWGRVGHDGQPRPLHIKQALDVIDFSQVEPVLPSPRYLAEENGVTRWELCRSPYFVVERVEMDGGSIWADSCQGETLQIWGTISGRATVSGGDEAVDLPDVTFALLPATLGPYTLTANEDTTLLRAYLPE